MISLSLNRAFITATLGEEFAQKVFSRQDIRWNGKLNGKDVQISPYLDQDQAIAVLDRQEAVEIFGWQVIAQEVLGQYILPWPIVELNGVKVQLSRLPGNGKSWGYKERVLVTVIPD